MEFQEIERTRERLASILAPDAPVVCVAYSGGKDSTLLLQLVLETRERVDPLHKIAVAYYDTGYELPALRDRVEAIGRQIATLENVDFFVTRPRVSEMFFAQVIGRGYAAPGRVSRACQTSLKKQPADRLHKRLRDDSGGELAVLLGRRKDESSVRRLKLESLGAPNTWRAGKLKGITVGDPCADITTSDAWDYLRTVEKFAWGATYSELESFYLKINNTRAGCWFCTWQTKERATDTARGRVREFLRDINDDATYRNLCATAAQMERVREGKAAGRFNYAGRRLILCEILSEERAAALSGADEPLPIISDAELRAINDLWTIDGRPSGEVAEICARYGRRLDLEIEKESEATAWI